MQAHVTTVQDLEEDDAACILLRLTKPGSEFQQEVKEGKSTTPIVVVWDGAVVAWAATHNWRGLQTLEAFTDQEFRRRGIATVAASMLIATGHIERANPVAVFSPLCVSIAATLGCRDVRLFERRGDDWVQNS